MQIWTYKNADKKRAYFFTEKLKRKKTDKNGRKTNNVSVCKFIYAILFTIKFQFVNFDFDFTMPLTNSKKPYTSKNFSKSFVDKALI